MFLSIVCSFQFCCYLRFSFSEVSQTTDFAPVSRTSWICVPQIVCAKVLLFSERYFANVIILCNFAVEDCTGGQQYSFFDGILAFAIRHARWNVGNFKRCIEYETIANVRDIVDVTCRILSISYGCNADRFRPRFVSVG